MRRRRHPDADADAAAADVDPHCAVGQTQANPPSERTMQQCHTTLYGAFSMLHYHLLHFCVFRVPFRCLLGLISILHILQISVMIFRYRLQFLDIGYNF
jgi:hypothetical protein